MIRHLVIPDTQVTPDSDTDHIRWLSDYTIEMKPDVIIMIGDWWDMPSLSSYDVGKKSFEGRRYLKDIDAGNRAMRLFLEPIQKESKRLKKNKKRAWEPRLVFCLGNHENRIERAAENDPKLEGVITLDHLALKDWEVVPFLKPIVIDGVAYCHYFCSGVMGRPVSSAKVMLTKQHMSCIMGHVQDRDIAFAKRADGTRMTGLFAGIYYPEDQEYLNPQTNNSWRGIWVLNEVEDGSFDELPVSMSYLRRKYAGVG